MVQYSCNIRRVHCVFRSGDLKPGKDWTRKAETVERPEYRTRGLPTAESRHFVTVGSPVGTWNSEQQWNNRTTEQTRTIEGRRDDLVRGQSHVDVHALPSTWVSHAPSLWRGGGRTLKNMRSSQMQDVIVLYTGCTKYGTPCF